MTPTYPCGMEHTAAACLKPNGCDCRVKSQTKGVSHAPAQRISDLWVLVNTETPDTDHRWIGPIFWVCAVIGAVGIWGAI